MEVLMKKRKFKKTNIASPRVSGQARSAALNVRVTPAQKRLWLTAADQAGRSVSAWVENALETAAHAYPRIITTIARLAPNHDGWLPVTELCDELFCRWAWEEEDVHFALRDLADQERVVFQVAVDAAQLRLFRMIGGLFDGDGRPIVAVAI
ncbi:MAG: hypothetical protein ABI321_11480, partial [Polyangia bacterium]